MQTLNYANAKGENALDKLNQDVQAIMDSDGAVIINDALSLEECDQIVSEMRPFIDATPHGLHGLEHSRRVGALVARSPASHKAIAHPVMMGACEALLGEQSRSPNSVRRVQMPHKQGRYPWKLMLTQIIDVGPGQQRQDLHRGNGLWGHDFSGHGLELQIETMWALTDFTAENGATHVLPGSHRWQDAVEGDKVNGFMSWFYERPNNPSVQASMSKGSVLMWTGWTVHGAGANHTDTRRIGLNINYCLSMLAQEENQFLACPPHLARNLPADMRRLIGYTQSGSMNYFADCLTPKAALDEAYDVMVPGARGGQLEDRSNHEKQ
ncbi:MAG: phytanoyl-CoA dioxygenase family protein [Pseudomonadota bacterium]